MNTHATYDQAQENLHTEQHTHDVPSAQTSVVKSTRLTRLFHFHTQMRMAQQFWAWCNRGTGILPVSAAEYWRNWVTNNLSFCTQRMPTRQQLARTAVSSAVGASLLFSTFAPALQAATITVETTAVNDNDDTCDLVDAIRTANTNMEHTQQSAQ